jgi:hypothetical protein
VAALLLRGQLILEVHRGGAGLDERLHQLEGVERPAEPGLGVGDDRREPLRRVIPFRMRDLIRAGKRIVDALDERGRAAGGVEALIRIGLPGEVRVRGDLPAREIDRLQASLDHLHGLTARERAQRRYPLVIREQSPKALRAAPRQRVLDEHRAAKTQHVIGGIGTFDGRISHGRDPFLDPRSTDLGS